MLQFRRALTVSKYIPSFCVTKFKHYSLNEKIIVKPLEQELKPTKKVVKKKELKDAPEMSATPPPDIHTILSGQAQCMGCGATLQTDDTTQPGFVHPKSLSKYLQQQPQQDDENVQRVKYLIEQNKSLTEPPKNPTEDMVVEYKDLVAYKESLKPKTIVCMRCHQLQHYGKSISVDITPETFLLNKLKDKKALVVLIVDMFDVHSSFIPNFNEFIGENPVLIVGNKIDLLPLYMVDKTFTPMENWLRTICKEKGILNIKGLILVSSTLGINIRTLGAKIQKLRENQDVYVVGSTNVGKSTLINKLLRVFGGVKHSQLTTSPLPGTTISSMSFPLKGFTNSYLFDTPGIINKNLVSNYLSPNEWKFANPIKTVKPRHYRLSPGQSLFIGGLTRIDYLSNDIRQDLNPIIFSVFVSRDVPLHATKIEKADYFYQTQLGNLIYPPQPDNTDLLGLESEKIIEFNSYSRKQSCLDIEISGLGWVTLTAVGDNVKIRVKYPKKLEIYSRPPLITNAAYKLRKELIN